MKYSSKSYTLFGAYLGVGRVVGFQNFVVISNIYVNPRYGISMPSNGLHPAVVQARSEKDDRVGLL